MLFYLVIESMLMYLLGKHVAIIDVTNVEDDSSDVELLTPLEMQKIQSDQNHRKRSKKGTSDFQHCGLSSVLKMLSV